MLPEKTLAWGLSRSCIRELAEYGARRKAEIGAENVYDFSLGNPSVPSPEIVNASIAELIKDNSVNIHGYTTAAGILSLREKLAADLNSRFGLELTPDLFYVTCGAAASLTVTLKAILFPGDEVITVAPFFPEYRVFVEAVGGVLKVVPAAPDFQIDLDAFEKLLSDKTKAVIINSPNNPSGAVFSEDCIKGLAAIMKRHEEKTGETLYLISDEPYREIVYGDITVPCTMNYYDDAIICYSFSKSLSVPGERIGYIAVSNKLNDCRNVYASIMGAYAADIIAAGRTNRVVALRKGEIVDIDIEEALAMQKSIPEYQFQVAMELSR